MVLNAFTHVNGNEYSRRAVVDCGDDELCGGVSAAGNYRSEVQYRRFLDHVSPPQHYGRGTAKIRNVVPAAKSL